MRERPILICYANQLTHRKSFNSGLQWRSAGHTMIPMSTPTEIPAFNRAEITEQEYFEMFGIHADGDPEDNYDPDFAGPDDCEFEEYDNR